MAAIKKKAYGDVGGQTIERKEGDVMILQLADLSPTPSVVRSEKE